MSVVFRSFLNVQLNIHYSETETNAGFLRIMSAGFKCSVGPASVPAIGGNFIGSIYFAFAVTFPQPDPHIGFVGAVVKLSRNSNSLLNQERSR